MAPKGKSQHRANLGYDHGKAVLCSNIHQRGKLEAYNKEYRRVYGHRDKDQGIKSRDTG